MLGADALDKVGADNAIKVAVVPVTGAGDGAQGGEAHG
jgi:hypothetical protein